MSYKKHGVHKVYLMDFGLSYKGLPIHYIGVTGQYALQTRLDFHVKPLEDSYLHNLGKDNLTFAEREIYNHFKYKCSNPSGYANMMLYCIGKRVSTEDKRLEYFKNLSVCGVKEIVIRQALIEKSNIVISELDNITIDSDDKKRETLENEYIIKSKLDRSVLNVNTAVARIKGKRKLKGFAGCVSYEEYLDRMIESNEEIRTLMVNHA